MILTKFQHVLSDFIHLFFVFRFVKIRVMIRIFVIGLALITLLSLAALISILFYFDPFQADMVIIALVYLTLFFGLTGIFSLSGLLIQKIRIGKNLSFTDMGGSFGYGLLLSLILVCGLAVWVSI